MVICFICLMLIDFLKEYQNAEELYVSNLLKFQTWIIHHSSHEILKLENLSLYVANVFFAVLVRVCMHSSYFSIKLQEQEVVNTAISDVGCIILLCPSYRMHDQLHNRILTSLQNKTSTNLLLHWRKCTSKNYT